MNNKLILHIPHASAKIPFKDGYLVGENELQQEILKLTDWHTDELFESRDDLVIKAPFSRVFCDVERFADDDKEVMAKYGMGVLYEKSDEGFSLRAIDKSLRQKIMIHHYYPHHTRLYVMVNSQLQKYGTALLLDCHSFPDKPFNRDLDQSPNRPDFNIGTHEIHTTQKLIDFSIDFFKTKGYSLVSINLMQALLCPMHL